MLRSVYAGSALTAVMLVAMPFFGTAGGESSSLLSSRPGASALVVMAAGSAGPEDSITSLIEFVEHTTGSDAESDDRASNDGEHQAQSPNASSSTTPTGTSGSARAPGSDDATSGGSTSGGSEGSTPSPSAPASPSPTTTPSTPPAPAAPPTPSTPPAPAAPPACPAAIGGSTPGAPSRVSPLGVAGTSSADLQSFAERYNAIRIANCLPPVPFANFRYDSCMENRLYWMAEDPSTDPMSAWGHIGSIRSDGVPSVGCDGNLAGGSGNTGATVAQKWWDSSSHRASLYKPTHTGGTGGVCILFAMTHGGVPNEPASFTRSAARWVTC